MIEEIERLFDEYWTWLKDGTSLKEVDEWVEVTTPYLDRHNDHLQFYVRRDNGGYLLTDEGVVIEDLRRSGCDIDTPKRKKLMQLTLSGFGIELKDQELLVHARPDTFSQRKHNLVQAMLAVNDLFYLAEPHVASLFLEDVQSWMDILDGCVTMLAKSAALSSRKLERHWQSEWTDDDHAPCNECQRLLDDLYDRLAKSIVESINEWNQGENHD